jgi:signal peptidase I
MTERDLYGLPPADEPETEAGRDDDAHVPEWLRATPGVDAGATQPDPVRDPWDEPAPVEPDGPGAGAIVLGALSGLVAAVAGAAAWGLLSDWSDRELGVAAAAIGVLVAGVTRFVAGRGSAWLQATAIVESVGAILVGKYVAFALVLQADFGASLPLLSGDTVDLFRTSLGDAFDLIDLAWVGLAIGACWVILYPTSAEDRRRAAEAPRDYHTRNPVDRLTRGLPHGLRVTIDWLVTIVGALAIVLLVKAFVVNPYRIPSSSMEPTLHCARPGNDCEARFSDRVLANRFIYHLRDPERGEIVVFDTPPNACGVGGTFVKRVIGLPGEKLEVRLIRGDGYVFINGKRLDEPYVRPDRRQVGASFGPVTVPKGHYFMLGDNREQSCDSREWGALPRQNLIGKVFATYWPPQRLSLH